MNGRKNKNFERQLINPRRHELKMSLCVLSKKLTLEEEKNKRDCSTKFTVIDRIKKLGYSKGQDSQSTLRSKNYKLN